jgi:outer membrane protein assembly factor BamB
VLFAGACGSDDLTQPPPQPPEPVAPPPRLVSAVPSANSHNALSATIAVTAEHADSARLLFVTAGEPVEATPFAELNQGVGSLTPLGLRAGTQYRGVVELGGAGGLAQSDSIRFAAGDLPEALQRLAITTSGTGGPGLTITSLPIDGTIFAIGFDAGGTIRWYRGFPSPAFAGGDTKQQPNGNFTTFLGATTGSQLLPGSYVEFTPTGDSLRAFTVAEPRYMDNHEIWITGSGADERIHFFTYDHRTTDITAFGGAPDGLLAGHQLVRLRSDGATEFEWNAWDHLALDEWIEPPQPGGAVPPDYDHPNSVTFDRDGHYIVSMRHLGQVLKIDAATGAILWRLGGAESDFSIVNDPLDGFSAQHSALILPNGNLLLFDNGTRHDPPESRAVEYALDPAAGTATLVWEFRHSPAIYTPFTGSVQRLANGNTLIGYAWVGRAVEVSSAGTVAWEAELAVNGEPPLLYRLTRVTSLYQAP